MGGMAGGQGACKIACSYFDMNSQQLDYKLDVSQDTVFTNALTTSTRLAYLADHKSTILLSGSNFHLVVQKARYFPLNGSINFRRSISHRDHLNGWHKQ